MKNAQSGNRQFHPFVQRAPKAAPSTSWWLVETREQFTAAARQRNLEMQYDPKWKSPYKAVE